MSNRLFKMIAIALVILLAVIVIWRLVRGGSGEEGGEIEADMAVHVGHIVRATLQRSVTAYGAVEPEPAAAGRQPAAADVSAPLPGIVAAVACHEGENVERGALLFRLDGRAAEVVRATARKNLLIARENVERKRKLLAAEGASRKEYLEAEQQLNLAQGDLEAADTALKLLQVTAPLAGTVVRVERKPGEAVEANTVLARIIDMRRLVAAAEVPSREAARLRAGQPVRYEAGGAGTVLYVGSQVDERSDTVTLRASLPPRGGWLPGQFLALRVVCETHADCLAVPEAAVISDFAGGDSGEIVIVAGDKAVRKAVRIGLRDSGLVEVVADGLSAGQAIVCEDAYALPAEPTRVHIVK
jgi:RND family efflux transporter MFP subunit